MCIYESALCCETGLCGVNVDPDLLRISTVLNTLKNEGITVERYNLKSAPMEFVKSNIVNQYVNEKGVEGLPVVTLDGEIVISGRYPTNEKILTLLELPAQILLSKGAADCFCGDDSAEEDVAYVEEDLRSPCTQEIAVFRAFAEIVDKADDQIVVIDTAPTGHTLLLLDSSQSYHKSERPVQRHWQQRWAFLRKFRSCLL
jgi:hypothetical protein